MAELDNILGKIDVSHDGTVKKIVLTQPLLAHLCDVAAVFEEIIEGAVFRRHFERILGAPLSQSLLDRLCVLALWHDFGKVSPLFQRKLANVAAPEGEKQPGSQNHIIAGMNIFSKNYEERRKKLFAPFDDWDPHSRYVQRIVLCHHGTVLNTEEIRRYADNSLRCWDKSTAYDPWTALEELMELTQSYYPDAFADDASALPANGVFQNLFAGTLMLADWIASDKRLFPFCGEDTDGTPRPFPAEADQLAWSRARAGHVLESIGWKIGTRRPNVVPDFAEQFGFAPNAIQREIDALPLRDDGGLFFLEAETGSGKTEAALRLYTRLLSAGLVDGLYFANPQRFAATQLFERMDAFSKRSFGQSADGDASIPVTLAVPGYLRVGSREGVRVGRFQVDWQELGDSAQCWSAEQPKRYLASPIASGTIDQALLAGLRVPHAHMRGAALQRSLLVVDEVHSSDAYMTRLTGGLLDLFARAGGYVLLMSATLGARARTEYLDKWNRARGRGTRKPLQVPNLKESVELHYPLLSSDCSEGQSIAETPICKSVLMQPENCMTDPARVARLAADTVKDFSGTGLCVLILRNTVRQAQATFAELQKLLPPEKIFSVNGHATIHHSRYAPEDRRLLDDAVEKRFGKNVEKGCPQLDRPRECQVLIATQTLEQSLDVDFDLLITDLCPADVLLQRIGRLFRHKRVRPKGCAEPRCIVLLPENHNWLLTKAARAYGFGDERAYGNLPALAATWDLIAGNPKWELPQQNRYLVEYSTHPDAIREEIKHLGGGKWQETYDRYYGSNTAQKNVAEDSRLKWDKPFKDTNVTRGRLVENISSRLGARDLAVKTEKPVPSPFGGQNLRSFSIPTWMLPRDDDEQDGILKPNENGDIVVAIQSAEDGLTFELGGKTYYYGVTGLQSDYEHDAAADNPS